MNTRQRQILMTLIDDYIKSARPVSSAALAQKFDLSPATLRLELADLTKRGFLLRPHISSGRVPTDKAYRFYVETLTAQNQLSAAEKRYLKTKIQRKTEMHQLMQAATQAVSELSHNWTLNFLEDNFFEFFESGFSRLFAEPEFSNHDLILNVSRFFDLADQMMADLCRFADGDFSVFIGQEGPLRRLPDCSLVSNRYCLASGQKGIISILGPKRMDYQHNISLLEYVSELLADSFSVNELTS